MKNIRRMARFVLPCLALALLAACAGPGEESTPPVKSSTPPVESSTPPVETPAVTQGDIFEAVQREPVLATVLYSPTEEELQTLENASLTRLDDSDGVYYDEVLVVPHYSDCTVTVEHIAWDEEGENYQVTGSLGTTENAGTVNGLLLRSDLPEGLPDLLITVTRTVDGSVQTGRCLLGYDGRGGSSIDIKAERED